MFTLPPWPPKEYELKEISNNYISSQEFTPYGTPRNTQPNVKKYLFPIPYGPEDSGPTSYPELEPYVFDKWVKYAKAEWVDRPNENAKTINEIGRKYNVQVTDTYNPTYKLTPKLFPRSYKYEIDYMINARLAKVTEKMEREKEEERRWFENIQAEKIAKANPSFKCDLQPPGWWKAEKPKDDTNSGGDKKKSGKSTIEGEEDGIIRWQKRPRVFDKTDNTVCKRKENMSLVGQPFQHEACIWYFINYPPPTIPYRPEKISK